MEAASNGDGRIKAIRTEIKMRNTFLVSKYRIDRPKTE
jgi:hypothetical protein